MVTPVELEKAACLKSFMEILFLVENARKRDTYSGL